MVPPDPPDNVREARPWKLLQDKCMVQLGLLPEDCLELLANYGQAIHVVTRNMVKGLKGCEGLEGLIVRKRDRLHSSLLSRVSFTIGP